MLNNWNKYGFKPDGNEKRLLHFVSQSIDVKIENSIAIICISQSFVNEYESPIEATYMLPNDPDQVLSKVIFSIGEKVVEGKVMEKEKA